MRVRVRDFDVLGSKCRVVQFKCPRPTQTKYCRFLFLVHSGSFSRPEYHQLGSRILNADKFDMRQFLFRSGTSHGRNISLCPGFLNWQRFSSRRRYRADGASYVYTDREGCCMVPTLSKPNAGLQLLPRVVYGSYKLLRPTCARV